MDALGKDWVASFADVDEKLPYMDAVLKESLRLYPPGHTLIREAESNMSVEGASIPSAYHLGSWKTLMRDWFDVDQGLLLCTSWIQSFVEIVTLRIAAV